MEFLQQLIDFILHIDRHLIDLCGMYGMWIYAILFLIVFCETGLVVTPFLPGDSLLFAIGSLAAIGAMHIAYAIPLLISAVLAGDNTNYWIGRKIGPKVFSKEKSRFFNKEYLDRTNRFYDKHGRITVILARFLPIIRTVCALRCRYRTHDVSDIFIIQRLRCIIMGQFVYSDRLFFWQYAARQTKLFNCYHRTCSYSRYPSISGICTPLF